MAPLKRQSEDEVFALLVAAAIAGERCPQTQPHGPVENRQAVSTLAYAGKIKVDIYFHNWRVVTILEGEHRGKSTAACPKADAKPYRTIQKGGSPHSYVSKATVTLPSTTTPWRR